MSINRARVFSVWLAAALLAAVWANPAAAEDNGSYGYIRVLEGQATLMQAGSGVRSDAELNQPLLAGDRLWVPARSRAEIVLSDLNIVRLDGGTELLLEKLAASPDSNARASVLRLAQGNIQLIVTTDSLGDELPRVETPNSTVYIQNFGTYRITADGGDWSEVVVRTGSAEVVTDRGSLVVRADERALIEGDEGTESDVRQASAFDALERWGRDLNDQYRVASSDLRYIEDDNLRYQAAPLNRYGSWVYIDSRPYWRPRVAADWRPYSLGRWGWTPSGIAWVSSEPWGWVPYHYGTWDYIPAYGWVWEPGYTFAPAWVYWYWGPTYTGWCPVGYYTRYYSARYGWPFHFGVYGWAGGRWDDWYHWNFVPHDHFGRRDQHRYAVPVDRLNRGGARELPRGIVTTDSKPLKPELWKDPDRAIRTLQASAGRRTAGATGTGGDLPDVTPFIGRSPKLPADVQRTVTAKDPERPRLAGTPLDPGTSTRKPVRTAEGSTPRLQPGGSRTEQGDRPSLSGGGRSPIVLERDRTRTPTGKEPAARAGVTTANPSAPTAEEGTTRTRPTLRGPSGSEGAPRPDRSERPTLSRPSVSAGGESGEPLPRRRVGPDDPDGRRYRVQEIPTPQSGSGAAVERKPIARPEVRGSGGLTTAQPRVQPSGQPGGRVGEGYARPDRPSADNEPSDDRRIQVRERTTRSEGYSRPVPQTDTRPDPGDRPSVRSWDRPSYTSPSSPRSSEPSSRPSVTERERYTPPARTVPSRPEPPRVSAPSRPSSSESERPRTYSRPERGGSSSGPSVRPSSPPSDSGRRIESRHGKGRD